jgi:GH25 family lysozyme M1 (1,4-beta-N-acetylmuramidase)
MPDLAHFLVILLYPVIYLFRLTHLGGNMNTRQAFGIDINEWSRKGGINYDLVQQHNKNGVYDFLIIKAGLGLFKSVLFDEQRHNSSLIGIPYTTYHLPDPRLSMREQARKYVDWLGTEEPSYIVDLESPARGVRPPNRQELLIFIDELEKLTKKQPVIYTRMNLLQEIGFLNDARNFPLWIAQYPFDRSLLPEKRSQYLYFHDFTRDYEWKLPPSVVSSSLKENVILWQFSEKGSGPYYVYSRTTADPRFSRGMEAADLNISTKGLNELMQVLFGDVLVKEPENNPDRTEVEIKTPTYPGLSNQDMINLIYKAARPFTRDPWGDWIVRAGLENLALIPGSREKPYTGPEIEALLGLTDQEKAAINSVMNPVTDPLIPIYPGLSNQDMINLIFHAARGLTPDPWNDWVLPAGLEVLAVPEENRGKPYSGPRIEDLPNLSNDVKKAILTLM